MNIENIEIIELWSLKLNPSDLSNIERAHNPKGGGGQRYIQIGSKMVQPTLDFLKIGLVDLPHVLRIHCIGEPGAVDDLEFHLKSSDQSGGTRMRIANQNRHSRQRCRAWSPERGFPSLDPAQDTGDAQTLFEKIGGVHIFLVRDRSGRVWGGYTTGSTIPDFMRNISFAKILYGGAGGHWTFEESKG
jgi:hypothetical protein